MPVLVCHMAERWACTRKGEKENWDEPWQVGQDDGHVDAAGDTVEEGRQPALDVFHVGLVFASNILVMASKGY